MKKASAASAAVLNLLLLGTAVATIAARLGSLHWLMELFSHFHLQHLLIQTALAIIFVARRQWRRSLLVLPLVALNLQPLAPYLWPASPSDTAPAPSDRLKVMSVNLSAKNTKYSAVLDLLRAENPDVLVLQEYSPRWARRLAPLKKSMPYAIETPRSDFFGIALYSRRPFLQQQTFDLAGATPAIAVTVPFPAAPVAIVGVHLRPPQTRSWATARNAQLDALAERASRNRQPLIIVGDFNAAPWSPVFAAWLEGSGLTSHPGTGPLFTWPTGLPIFWIPIDLFISSKAFTIKRQQRGPPIGSDHYPLIVEVALDHHE